MKKASILLLLSLAIFLTGCNQVPGQVRADDAQLVDVLSPDGTVSGGRIVVVRESDGTLRRLVVLDRGTVAPTYARTRSPYRSATYRRSSVRGASVEYRQKRSWKKSAMIIGGSAGAGALVGGVAKGKKGAAVGALAGGLGGLAYDLITRNKN